MGSQRPGFSSDLVDGVAEALGPDESRLEWQEIHWAYALKHREDRLWSSMNEARSPEGDEIPLDWRPAREFVVHNFGDALAYHRDYADGTAYERIHGIISAEVAALDAALDDPDAPIVVVAHSLGAHIMSNYLWDRQRPADDAGLRPIPGLVSMITFGCNIPLFSLAFEISRPILLPAPGVPEGRVRAAGRWLNFMDADDVLGWPMKPLYAGHMDELTPERQRTVERIEDRTVNAGGIATSWNPGSHTGYDSDGELIASIAAHLRSLLDAADADAV
jgi:hypothetical protein